MIALQRGHTVHNDYIIPAHCRSHCTGRDSHRATQSERGPQRQKELGTYREMLEENEENVSKAFCSACCLNKKKKILAVNMAYAADMA